MPANEDLELETKARTIINIAEAASDAFKGHRLVEASENCWRLATPGTAMYSFRVAEQVGMIALWGDISSIMVDAGKSYDIEWLRGAIESPYYVLQKCSLANRKHFYAGDFKAYVLGANGKIFADFFENDWSVDSMTYYVTHTGDTEVTDVAYGYSPSNIWSYFGFKKFIELMEKM